MENLSESKFDICTKDTLGQVTYLTERLLKLERSDYYQKQKSVIDAFGPSWLVIWFTASMSPVYIRNYKKYIEIPKDSILFIPPFSILSWLMPAHITKWKAYVPADILPNTAPKIPTLYAGLGDNLQADTSSLIRFVCSQPILFAIEQERVKSSLAKKLKNFIDTNYKDNFRIQDIAKQFGVSRVVLSRSFHKCYQLSPLQYRQRIRIFDALSQMNLGTSVTTALFESGFSNVSEFNRQFKNTLDTTPKNYSPLNRKKLSGLKPRPLSR